MRDNKTFELRARLEDAVTESHTVGRSAFQMLRKSGAVITEDIIIWQIVECYASQGKTKVI